MKIDTLKKSYEETCNQYIEYFSKKHDLEFHFWVGDEIGGVACFNHDFFFSLQEIALDINSLQPKDKIIDWYNYTDSTQFISYSAYINGYRYETPIFNI